MDFVKATLADNALISYLSDGKGGFVQPAPSTTLPDNFYYILAADVNGDKKTGIIAWEASGIMIALAKGDGTFMGPGSSLRSLPPRLP